MLRFLVLLLVMEAFGSMSVNDNEGATKNELVAMNRELMAMNRKLMDTIKETDHRLANMETKFEEQDILNQRLVSAVVSEAKHAAFDTDSTHTLARRFVLDGNVDQVAFLASRIDKNNIHSGLLGSVVFHTVLLNSGGHYDYNNGVFTAPMRGIYLFSSTLLSPIDSEVRASITVNNNISAVSIFGHGSGGQRASATQVALIALNPGDRVTVVNSTVIEFPPFGTDPYNSFTGVLLIPN